MRASFYVTCFGILTGVFWRSFFIVDEYSLALVFLLALFSVGVGALIGFHWRGLYLGLFLLTLLLGVLRTQYADNQFMQGRVFREGDEVVGVAVVCAEPDERDGYTLLTLCVEESGTLYRARASQYPEFTYGEVVHFTGQVHVPESFTTDTGRVFDYEGYLKKDGVHYELLHATLEGGGEVKGNLVKRYLLTLKQRWLDALSLRVPEPEASLAGGVVVGAKRSLGDDWLAAFRDTGIIHIVVLSGYNLTLIANAVVRATGVLPRAVGFGLGIFSVVSFASMVGAGATVVRASVMAILGMLAVFIQRPYMLMRALMLAGVLMVLWNPFVLVYDPGFQLSFIATLGLILIAPKLERFFLWVPEQWTLREIVLATCATQLAVLPLLLFQMGRVSLVAPVVNVLVLPVVPFVMLTGFLTGILEMFHIVLSVPFGFVTYLILRYMFGMVSLFSTVPLAAVDVPPIPWWLLVLMYLLPILFMVYKHKTTQP